MYRHLPTNNGFTPQGRLPRGYRGTKHLRARRALNANWARYLDGSVARRYRMRHLDRAMHRRDRT
jgi:hypothetical protein